MRTRGLVALFVVLLTAGCTSGTPSRLVGAPSPSVPGSSVPIPTPASASSKAPTHRPSTPAPHTTTVAPSWCQQSDVAFTIDAATGGDDWQWFGSVMVSDVSGRTCALSNYLILRWRDAHGTVLPVTVAHIAGPEPPGFFFLLRPGTRGIAGIYWQKYTAFHSTQTCPPFATTLDIWPGSTLEDPHPEQRPPAHVPWFTGTTGSICGGTVKLEPLDRAP